MRRFEGWLGPLNKAIYPSRANWRRGVHAEGCPDFGQATVLDRPLDYDRQEEFSVKPGLIRPEHGEHEVVWWDPSKLELNVEGGLGLHQKEILAEDGGASLATYREWERQRADTLIAVNTAVSRAVGEPGRRTLLPAILFRSRWRFPEE